MYDFPGLSVVRTSAGSLPRLHWTALNLISPVNGSVTSLPGTGAVKSMISVQTPAIGLDVYSDSCRRGDSTGTPVTVNPVAR